MNRNQLKIAACISMLLDHIGVLVGCVRLAPEKAKAVRAFVFTRGGKRLLAYWHMSGSGRVEIACGAGGARQTVPADRIRYLETDLSVDAVKRAYAAAVLLP